MSNFLDYIWKYKIQKLSLPIEFLWEKKNFALAHELGHHSLGHALNKPTILCDKNAVFGNNKPEIEKELDYFPAWFLMPKNLIKIKQIEFEKNYNEQVWLYKPQSNQ